MLETGKEFRKFRLCPDMSDTLLTGVIILGKHKCTKQPMHTFSKIILVNKHQENMSVKCVPPQTPLLYSKTGVCRGIPIFLIFAPKHRLWVLVRTASARGF